MKTIMKSNSKVQRRKIGVAGSLQNQMMGNNATTPKVGEGATLLSYTDRSAYEVISVSDNGNSCVIRKMNCIFVGNGYGDERYEYKSDLDGITYDLEWNEKKGKWGKVVYTVDVIKALEKKLSEQYEYPLRNLPGGLTYDDLKIEDDNARFGYRLKLVKGVTKEYKHFYPVSVIFGVMDQYRDPSF